MTNREPTIGNYITHCSASVSCKASVRTAALLMKMRNLPYIPVVSGKDIVGLLPSSRVRAALSYGGAGVSEISDLMIRSPSVVSPDTCLYTVLDETPGNSCGCTVVQDNSGKISGVFTPNDAVLAFRSLIGIPQSPLRP